MKSKEEAKYLVQTVNGDREFTREEMIQLHRCMWNWITEQLEIINSYAEINSVSIYGLKSEWCNRNGFINIEHRCFCCEYAIQNEMVYDEYHFCHHCPLNWGEAEKKYPDFYCENRFGLWQLCKDAGEKGKINEAIELARQIANLPESEGR